MAKVSYVDITAGLEESYWSGLTPQSRYTHARVTRKTALLSVKRKKGLSQRSMLPQVAERWAALSPSERDAWVAPSGVRGFKPYNLFTQDVCARIINEKSGAAMPSVVHQTWCGHLHIEAPASELKIVQYHPERYYVSAAVPKHKGMRQPVLVVEGFGLPVTFSLAYKGALTAAGASPFAKFYAVVYSKYQGLTLQTNFEVPLSFSSGWTTGSVTCSGVTGEAYRYDLYFHLFNVTGDLYCDNIKAWHNGQNWCRDPFCEDINQGFTLAFYQVPKHWAGVSVPVGSWYESDYIET